MCCIFVDFSLYSNKTKFDQNDFFFQVNFRFSPILLLLFYRRTMGSEMIHLFFFSSDQTEVQMCETKRNEMK